MAIGTTLLLLHLIGLSIGLGAAVAADFLFFNSLIQNRLSPAQFKTLRTLNALVTIGLLVLGLTGVGFLIHYELTNSKFLVNPRLWAKLSMIVVLAANSFFMHDYILPLLSLNLNRPLTAQPAVQKSRAILFSSGAVSVTTWLAVTFLGAWKMRTPSYVELMEGYGALTLAAIVISPLAAYLLVYLARKNVPAPLQEVLDERVADASVGACHALVRREMRRAERAGETLNVVLLEFDVHANLRGDQSAENVERFDARLADLMYDHLREVDHVGTLGQGRFILLLPVARKMSATQTFNRLAEVCSQTEFIAGDFTPVARAEQQGLVFDCRGITLNPSIEHTAENLVQLLESMPIAKSLSLDFSDEELRPPLRLVS